MPLTLGGLVGSGIYAGFHHLWAAVLLTIALTIVSDFKPRERRLVFALTLASFAIIFQPSTAWICLLVLAIWLLWEFGVLGGADVKLLIATSLLLGVPAVLIPIAVAGGVQGVIAYLRQKQEIPFVVSIFCGTFLFVLFPYF